jgi:DNA-binding response OmpR family regulator
MATQRVLVVDDEPKIRSILRAYLEADGFSVDEAATGADAVALATGSGGADRPDLVLLDIGLPDVDGLDVLRQVRTAGELPVSLVPARAEEVDTIVGLRVGADDYVTKPFSPREVVARVHTVLRRAGSRAAGAPASTGGPAAQETEDVLRFEGLTIDVGRREIARDTLAGAEPVELSALEFDLLVALARSPGRVWSRTQLLEQVWGYDFYGDERVVDVHIRSMRRALGDDAAEPTVIGTVRGVGYKFLRPALHPAP